MGGARARVRCMDADGGAQLVECGAERLCVHELFVWCAGTWSTSAFCNSFKKHMWSAYMYLPDYAPTPGSPHAPPPACKLYVVAPNAEARLRIGDL
eukprot:3349299-Prymnesium_polylepis.1